MNLGTILSIHNNDRNKYNIIWIFHFLLLLSSSFGITNWFVSLIFYTIANIWVTNLDFFLYYNGGGHKLVVIKGQRDMSFCDIQYQHWILEFKKFREIGAGNRHKEFVVYNAIFTKGFHALLSSSSEKTIFRSARIWFCSRLKTAKIAE